MSDIATLLTVSATLLAAVFGAIVTVICTSIKDARKQKKFEKQVENIMRQSCKKVIRHLEAMEEEEYEQAVINLKYRIEGIKIIERLISDFSLDKILGIQVYTVFRIREQINDLIGDLSNFNDNYFKVRQREVDINHLIENNSSQINKEELEKQKRDYLNKLKTDYKTVLLRQIAENKEQFYFFIKNYHLIAKEIKKDNKNI